MNKIIMSTEAIIALLREQAALRSPENDEGGILKEAAAKLADDLEELWAFEGVLDEVPDEVCAFGTPPKQS